MLRNDCERKICAEYSKKDENGRVRCSECPLLLIQITSYGACKANHHWSNEREEWVADEVRN